MSQYPVLRTPKQKMTTLVLERLGDGAAFLLQDDETGTSILLGCGEVKALNYADGGAGASKRSTDADCDEDGAVDIASNIEARYLSDLKAIVRRDTETPLTVVLVTDYRPDTCFMLPFLTERASVVSAQQPQLPFPIISTHATKALAPHLLAEYWTSLYGKVKDKSALYDVKDIPTAFRRAHGVGLKASVAVNEHIKVTAFHAGHVAGGCAFNIEIGATSVLYINDFNLGGGRVLLPAQIPRVRPTAMITRSTFAVTVSETRTTIERELMKMVYECVAADGKVIIPVNKTGFVQEVLAILTEYWAAMGLQYPIFISDDVMDVPSAFHALLRPTYTAPYAATLKTPSVIPQRFEWKRIQQPGSFVLFTTPANLSQGDSCRAIKAAAADPKNLIVLSEYCKPGTVNYSLYSDPVRREASKRLGVSISCGVHFFPCSDEVDAKSIVELVRHVDPQHVYLDYVVANDVEFMKAHIEEAARSSTENSRGVPLVQEISHDELTVIEPSRQIPLRIHKSMFNNPADVQGILIAEPKRKLVLVSATTGARRFKKKRHTLSYQSTWKKPVEPSHRVKKKSSRAPASALSFLLSAPAESADEEEPEEQPEADLDVLDAALETALKTWLADIPVECNNRWFKLRSVCVLLSSEWAAHLEWGHEDEELAGRVVGIAKQVIYAEFAKKTEEP